MLLDLAAGWRSFVITLPQRRSPTSALSHANAINGLANSEN
jgi:hypothetical protein